MIDSNRGQTVKAKSQKSKVKDGEKNKEPKKQKNEFQCEIGKDRIKV